MWIRHELIARARERGEYLTDHLAPLNRIARVGEIRGQGLLRTIELVADKSARTPIPPESLFVERVFEKLRHNGVLVHAVRGTVDGTVGEHLMLAPPFVITEAEIDRIVQALEDALRSTSM
ncbi:MAG TPA: aminotransferase class III-fold pyridoxal phosphate-dependent enzyme [Vicinamibacterales bacterium]|nr:aminotransferase class III-fold pyridoxal phosphate-dependent enzyme [Vicinamibacterales bacterium]